MAPRRYKGARGGRGSGKTHFFGERIIEEMIDGHIRAACLREHQNSIKDSSKALLEKKIQDLGVRHLFSWTDFEIRGPNDSLIIFRGLQNHTASSMKSLEGFNRAWVDEAQTISQRSLSILTPTFRAPSSEMAFSWNPNSEKDPVDRLFMEADGDPNIVHVHANYYDNPWFPSELRADMERDRRRDPDKYRHVWLGEYGRNSEARVFRNWRIGEVEIPPGARPYYGADWGFSVDPTVLMRCWVFPGSRTLYIDRELYRIGLEIDRTPAFFDLMNDERCENIRNWPIIADSARPETISFMRHHGFPKIEPAMKGPGSVDDGIEFLKNHDIVIHPACRHTSDEFSHYSYKIDKQTEEVLPELDDKKNHVIDAARYAVEKLRRNPPLRIVMPESMSAPRNFPG